MKKIIKGGYIETATGEAKPLINKGRWGTKQSEPKQEAILNCGCKIGVCTCDPMRHWPPKTCKKCPATFIANCKPLEQKCIYASSGISTKCVVSGCKNKMYKSCFCKKHQQLPSKPIEQKCCCKTKKLCQKDFINIK